MRSVDQLVELYFTSVGRNAKLLLNVPPTREGLLHTTDASRLAGMRERLSTTFAEDLARGRSSPWTNVARTASVEIDLGRTPVAATIFDGKIVYQRSAKSTN